MEQIQRIAKFFKLIPKVNEKLGYWHKRTLPMPSELRIQAQSSLTQKGFHCIGGSVFAIYPNVDSSAMLQAIISLQTISDYLDNLCDRFGIQDPAVFRSLHQSFADSLRPHEPIKDYYRCFPVQETTYLPLLVKRCQQALLTMPYWEHNQPYANSLASHYIELQVRKHVPHNPVPYLKEWIDPTFSAFLPWNEWAAACGSTLGIFMLFACSYFPFSQRTTERIMQAYFPWIQALHILLDYFIDQSEDVEHGDLNFTSYHRGAEHSIARLQFFAQESNTRVKELPHPGFHKLVIEGLHALYLSDEKVRCQGLSIPVKPLLRGFETKTLYRLCQGLRFLKAF